MATGASIDGDSDDLGPLDLDAFLAWCQEVLDLDRTPEPEVEFRKDLGLDDVELFSFVLRFDGLAASSSRVTVDVFDRLSSMRDLYLYYLMIGSMPYE